MDIQQLNSMSPLRVFEESINGGLGKGNLGVIVSKHGVGKTACLVHLATDKLFKGENVIHVSFSGNVEHVINWYKEVFREIAAIQSLDDAAMVYNSILANRVVMNFSQEQISIDKVLASLESLISQGSFKADTILFDGFKLTVASEEDIQKIKAFAEKMQIEIWFAVSPVDLMLYMMSMVFQTHLSNTSTQSMFLLLSDTMLITDEKEGVAQFRFLKKRWQHLFFCERISKKHGIQCFFHALGPLNCPKAPRLPLL